ncbi:hypothetical protein SAMN04489760_10315 [Syntrophus gentianae]|uniref:DUF5320 domain-containing protein n=1 Tax=Syntrophus gentianae TaxID=43775 RepID=A0A1H7V4W0_9BACT|nr:DUF5320 domain-containing protein [Syntrophus gentianae]SEM04089.1 hypothetical protein SAMN04489760_10315 [Syntrophus gentianae]
MPRGDGTGPMGIGPMTGRGAGLCSRLGATGYSDVPPAYGMGYGRGWRNRFFASGLFGWMRPAGYAAPYQRPDPELEKQMLKREADTLRAELNYLQKRLDEMESEKPSE